MPSAKSVRLVYVLWFRIDSCEDFYLRFSVREGSSIAYHSQSQAHSAIGLHRLDWREPNATAESKSLPNLRFSYYWLYSHRHPYGSRKAKWNPRWRCLCDWFKVICVRFFLISCLTYGLIIFSPSTISLIGYDISLNVFLTTMFLWPLWISHPISPRLRSVAKRTL